jgi:hypothetical protein
MNINNAAVGVCAALNEHAQLGHEVHSPTQTQGDIKALSAVSKYFFYPIDYFHSASFPAAGRNRPTQALPNELLLHIFSYVERQNDLANLCQCSKAFRNIADGYLYRDLNLYFYPDGDSDETASFKLLQSIQKSRYSSIVKELTVKVDVCTAKFRKVDRDGCPCSKIDTLLQKALHHAEALEVLRIQCVYCWSARPERHRLLTELPTRKLRELTYECNCGLCWVGSSTRHMPAPNWVRSVTSLNLRSGNQWACPEEVLQTWMQNGEFLPNLHTLNYYGPGICSELLANRVIRRLVAMGEDPNDALSRHPDKKALIHLAMREGFMKTFLSSVGNIIQFSNLQHIGSLWPNEIYFMPEDERVGSILHY